MSLPFRRFILGLAAPLLGRLDLRLKGNAYAGAAGDSNCFIVALEMDPIQIQIGDILAKSPDHKKMKPRRLRRKEKTPVTPEAQIAVAKGGNIYIEPVTRGSLNDYTR